MVLTFVCADVVWFWAVSPNQDMCPKISEALGVQWTLPRGWDPLFWLQTGGEGAYVTGSVRSGTIGTRCISLLRASCTAAKMNYAAVPDDRASCTYLHQPS